MERRSKIRSSPKWNAVPKITAAKMECCSKIRPSPKRNAVPKQCPAAVPKILLGSWCSIVGVPAAVPNNLKTIWWYSGCILVVSYVVFWMAMRWYSDRNLAIILCYSCGALIIFWYHMVAFWCSSGGILMALWSYSDYNLVMLVLW